MIYFISDKLITDPRFVTSGDIELVFKWAENKTFIQVDTETTGLFDWKSTLLCVQIGNFDDQFVVDWSYIKNDNLIINRISDEILNNDDKVKLFWNSKFDIKMLWQHGIKINNVYDGMLAEYIIHCGKEVFVEHVVSETLNLFEESEKITAKTPKGFYTLKQNVLKYTGAELDKTNIQTLLKMGLTADTIVYAACDVKYLEIIKDIQTEEIKKYDLEETLNLENKAVFPIAAMEYVGIGFDCDKWRDIMKEVDKDVVQYEIDLDKALLNEPKLSKYHKFQKDIDGNLKSIIKWTSAKEASKILKLIGYIESSTGKMKLLAHSGLHPIIKLLAGYRELMKMQTSYGENMISHVNLISKRIHSDYFQILKTGRMSSTNPNLQNLPSKGKYAGLMRSCFVPEQGYKIVGGDYSSAELRVIANFSEEDSWLEEFKHGQGKIHDMVASNVFNIPLESVKTKSEKFRGATYRDIAKTINFGLAYGMSAHKLSATLQIPLKEAEEIIKMYFKALPKIKRFLTLLGDFGKKNRFIRTPKPFKRIRWFNQEPRISPKELGRIERQSKNTPIQGANGDFTKLALVMIYEVLNERYKTRDIRNWDVKLINVIHDEIQCEVKESVAYQWKDEMADLMSKAAEQVVNKVPMPVECSVNDYWKK
jgi:DNA polymerase-1